MQLLVSCVVRAWGRQIQVESASDRSHSYISARLGEGGRIDWSAQVDRAIQFLGSNSGHVCDGCALRGFVSPLANHHVKLRPVIDYLQFAQSTPTRR